MLRRALALVLAPLFALGCNHDRRAPVQAVLAEMDANDAASTPSFTDDPPRLLPQLGALSFSAAQPGEYSASFVRDRQSFRTPEIVEVEHVGSSGQLTLGPGAGAGEAQGCFRAAGNTHVSIGAYASADHKQHDSDTPVSVDLGGRGEWKRGARGWVIVSLAIVSGCPPPASIDPATPRMELRCVAVVRAAAPGPPALLCDDARGALSDVALPLGSPTESPPWMWLAPESGIAITLNEERDVVTVTFGDVPAK